VCNNGKTRIIFIPSVLELEASDFLLKFYR